MSAGAVLAGFAVMIVMLLLSFPVAVIMVVTGVIGGLLVFGWPLVTSMGPVAWGVQNENILTAIPTFYPARRAAAALRTRRPNVRRARGLVR